MLVYESASGFPHHIAVFIKQRKMYRGIDAVMTDASAQKTVPKIRRTAMVNIARHLGTLSAMTQAITATTSATPYSGAVMYLDSHVSISVQSSGVAD